MAEARRYKALLDDALATFKADLDMQVTQPTYQEIELMKKQLE